LISYGELSNWGRWEKTIARDDELDHRGETQEGSQFGEEGYTVSLARPVEKELAADNPDPFGHKMTLTGISNPGNLLRHISLLTMATPTLY
jgi:hypothetical protein